MRALSRRAWLGLSAGLGAGLVGGRAGAVLRVPEGGALRLPLPATRRSLDPARAVDHADTLALGLLHEGVVAALPEGGFAYPLLEGAPAVARDDARRVVLTLRAGITFSDGAPVTAAAVVASWRAARQSPIGRLALSRLDTMNPFEARGEREVVVRLADPGTVDEVLAAHPLAVAGATSPSGMRAGLGAFVARTADGASLARNARCPTGAAFLDAVVFTAPRARNDELRAFTTGELDASWWGASLYEVSRAATVVRGGGVVVGLVPTPGGPVASAAAARSLERALRPLSTGDGATLSPFGFEADASATPPDVAALARALAPRGLRVAREASDGFSSAVAERVVALLDAAGVPVMLVEPDAPCDATLRAVAPLAGDAPVALASLVAASASAAGDEAGASAIVRTARAARQRVAAGVWGRGVVAALGTATPTLHVRRGVRDARFDRAGRLQLADAWIERA